MVEKAALNNKIKRFLLHHLPEPGTFPTSIEGFNIVRREVCARTDSCFEKPLAGLGIQGTKHSFMAGHEYVYGANHSIVAAVDMPVSSYIEGISQENPFLFLYLYLDTALLSSLIFEIGADGQPGGSPASSISVAESDPDLMQMFLRLLELTEKPGQITMRAPMMLRELHYLLLIGSHGKMLRKLYTPGTHNNQVVKAIAWIRENYKAPINIDMLARQAGMSLASLYRHFRRFTGLSPLQYQKQLRLHEARRMMISGHENASFAAISVGYESVPQFNRDYKKLFGEPPFRDINRRKATALSE